MNIPKLLRLSVILLATQLLGCSYQEQLEEVAKNWCMTIRASQVIPIYPLTEDLEPGDVFLVQIPVPRQAEQYKQKGFLPLDMHMVRLDIPRNEFLEFYDDFYDLVPNHVPNLPPHIWQDKPKINNERTTSNESTTLNENSEPNDSNEPNKIEEPNDANKLPDNIVQKRSGPTGHRDPTNWSKAPRAGFPSYTFKVKHGIAGAAALPIKGIPVAMSLLGADKATGSVTIKDSYTYGLSYDNIVQKLTPWARKNKDLLNSIRQGVIDAEPFPDQLWRFFSSPFVGHRERTIYLRIINRIYLTGSLTVSMTNTSAAAIKAATQSFKDVNLPNLSSVEDVNNYAKNIETINKTLAPEHLDTKQDAGAVGAALNVTWATFRSISIDERFDRPLVIGYLAFDFPVLPEGELGTPVATLNQISSSPVQTRSKELNPKSATILTGLLGRIADDLPDLAKSSIDDANTAQSHVQNLHEAARRILLPGTFYPRYTYNFDKRGHKLTETYRTNQIPSNPNLDDFIALWEEYKDYLSAIKQATSKIKSAQPLSIKYHDSSSPVKKPNKTDLNKLGRIYDEYFSRQCDLDVKMRSTPEVIDAVNYYTSLFSAK